jgi:hypothetical protein
VTRNEAMDQFDRLVAVSAPLPEVSATFDEWFLAFGRSSVDDVAEGITKLIASKSDRFFPSIGELRGCIASVQSGRDRGDKCRTCHGSTWIDAPPFRANGGHMYQGVSRCRDCGVPPPTMYGDSHQTPISSSELREWAQNLSREGGPMTKSELMARVQVICSRKKMPKVKLQLVED